MSTNNLSPKRYSGRRMSRPNRDKALARIYRELIELAYASPRLHQRGQQAPLQLPFPVGIHWDRCTAALLELWPKEESAPLYPGGPPEG